MCGRVSRTRRSRSDGLRKPRNGNIPRKKTRQPLRAGLSHGSAFDALLASGADANAADRKGTIPFEAAQTADYAEIAATLRRTLALCASRSRQR